MAQLRMACPSQTIIIKYLSNIFKYTIISSQTIIIKNICHKLGVGNYHGIDGVCTGDSFFHAYTGA